MTQTLSALLVLTQRILKRALVNPEVIVPALAGPIFMLVAFIGGLSGLARLPLFTYPAGYATFLYVALLFQAAGFGGAAVGATIAVDFESGFSRRLFLALPRRGLIIIAYAAAAALQALLIFGLLTLIGRALGVRLLASPGQMVLLFLLPLAFAYVAMLWGLGLAAHFRSSDGSLLANMPFMTAIFLAPIYLPLELLQGWIHTVAAYNPVTLLLEAGRELAAGRTPPLGPAAAVLAVLVVLATLFGRWSLNRAASPGGAPLRVRR